MSELAKLSSTPAGADVSDRLVTLIDPSHDDRWDRFVQSHRNGSLYHHSLWKEVIANTYGYEPHYYIVQSRGSIRAAVPFFLIRSAITGTRLVSLPFSDTCNPLVDDADDLRLILVQARDVANKIEAKEIEIRCIGDQAISDPKFVLRQSSHVNHRLRLSEELNVIKAGFHKNYILRNIKKAEREKVRINVGQTEHDMSTFYGLYLRTRRQHGLPAMPYLFFRNMWQRLYPAHKLQVLLAVHASKAIAGILIATHGSTMYYLYGGSNAKTRVRGASQLLLWHAIQEAHAAGLTFFDFGRTATNNIGLLEFKRRWGSEERPLTSCTWSRKPQANDLLLNRHPAEYGILQNLIKRLPLSVLRISGGLIYKHLG